MHFSKIIGGKRYFCQSPHPSNLTAPCKVFKVLPCHEWFYSSIRGKPLQCQMLVELAILNKPFSPLHSGQATAIRKRYPTRQLSQDFQSPPFGASHCNNATVTSAPAWLDPFSPLHSGQATAMPGCCMSSVY